VYLLPKLFENITKKKKSNVDATSMFVSHFQWTSRATTGLGIIQPHRDIEQTSAWDCLWLYETMLFTAEDKNMLTLNLKYLFWKV